VASQIQYKQALATSNFTIEYERSTRIVDTIIKDEDIRKLKCRLLLLQDENDSLNDQLATEEEHADELQHRLDSVEGELEELEISSREVENELRIKTREYENALVI
jgi:predicted  nucleic acid-binding Zn-ribbon protein